MACVVAKVEASPAMGSQHSVLGSAEGELNPSCARRKLFAKELPGHLQMPELRSNNSHSAAS